MPNIDAGNDPFEGPRLRAMAPDAHVTFDALRLRDVEIPTAPSVRGGRQ